MTAPPREPTNSEIDAAIADWLDAYPHTDKVVARAIYRAGYKAAHAPSADTPLDKCAAPGCRSSAMIDGVLCLNHAIDLEMGDVSRCPKAASGLLCSCLMQFGRVDVGSCPHRSGPAPTVAQPADPIDDLCARLRDYSPFERQHVVHQAADALQRLRAERDTLAAIVRAADEMRAEFGKDMGHWPPAGFTITAYDAARAKVKP